MSATARTAMIVVFIPQSSLLEQQAAAGCDEGEFPGDASSYFGKLPDFPLATNRDLKRDTRAQAIFRDGTHADPANSLREKLAWPRTRPGSGAPADIEATLVCGRSAVPRIADVGAC